MKITSFTITAEDKENPIIVFDSYKGFFEMHETYCENPDCDCREAFISFLELEKDDSIKKDGIEFSFYLDLNTWQENRSPKRPAAIQRIVDEFINELTAELKNQFSEHYKNAKSEKKEPVKYEPSKHEIISGAMFSYRKVMGEFERALDDNDANVFVLTTENQIFYIEDEYCMFHKCECEEVMLRFYELRVEINVLLDFFDCRFSFRKGLKIETLFRCTKKTAIKVFKEWRKSNPGVIEELKRRYKEMKQVGQKIIKETSRPKKSSASVEKISRNAPCPCGSGEKYKKCCGM